jgi:hypothetical protein
VSRVIIQKLCKPGVCIFLIALLVYSVLAFLFPISFYPDSEQYVRTAKAITGQSGGEYYYYRTIGYPILMVLTGVTKLQTFYILLAIQLLTAALIPSLIYATVARLNERAGLYAAVITMASFAPAFLWRTIMTDQIAMFLRFLLVFQTSGFLFGIRRHTLDYVNLIVVGLVLYVTRPSDALTLILIPAGLLLFRIGDWRKSALSILVFLAATIGVNKIRDAVAQKYTDRHHIVSTSVKGSMTGRMLFFNVYAVGPKLVGKPTVSPANGRQSALLFQTLVEWGRENPLGVRSYSIQGRDFYPSVYAGIVTPEDFASALIKEEALFAHSVMWLALDQQLGAYQADKVFLGSAIESYLCNPKALLLLYDGMVEFFFAGDVVYNAGRKETWNSDPTLKERMFFPANPSFPEALRNELKFSAKHRMRLVGPVARFLFYWIIAFKIVSVLLALAFLPATFFLGRKLACFSAIIVSMLLYHAAVAVAFAAPHFRYTLPQVPLLIILAALSVTSFGKLLAKSVSFRTGKDPVKISG